MPPPIGCFVSQHVGSRHENQLPTRTRQLSSELLIPPIPVRPKQVQMPFDGNSHKTMGLIAHPGEITSLNVSGDGSYLATAGGSDLTVNMWKINTQAVQVNNKGRYMFAIWFVNAMGKLD